MSQVQACGANSVPALTKIVAAKQSMTEHKAPETKLDIDEAVRDINESLQMLRRHESSFSVDEELDRIIIRTINADTKELIRQIPTEDALRLSKKMREMVGLLFG